MGNMACLEQGRGGMMTNDAGRMTNDAVAMRRLSG